MMTPEIELPGQELPEQEALNVEKVLLHGLEMLGLAKTVRMSEPLYEDDVFGVPSCCFDQM